MVNLFVICELDPWSRYLRTLFSIGDCLFRAVNLTENAHPDKYGYSVYGIGFDARSLFLLQHKKWGKKLLTLVKTKVYHCMLKIEKNISYFLMKN